MKSLFPLFLLALIATSPLAVAQSKEQPGASPVVPAKAVVKREPSAKQKAQQARMAKCNVNASDKKGNDRKKYMSMCLRGDDGVSNKQQAQRDKMTSCNKEASAMTGDARKQFMSTCLKA